MLTNVVNMSDYFKNVFEINRNRGRMGKSFAHNHVIAFCIQQNRSLIVGTSQPEARLKELQDKFPDATFRLHPLGVEICSQKQQMMKK